MGYESQRIFNGFKNVLQIMAGLTISKMGLQIVTGNSGFIKKFRRDCMMDTHNLDFVFQMQNWLHGKCENIQYLWQYATNFLQSFTIYF